MSRSARAVASASAVLLTSLVLAAPASAVEPAGERSAVCFPGQDPPVANGGRTVRAGDEANLTAAQVDQAERQLRRALAQRSPLLRQQARAGVLKTVPVHLHVLGGRDWRGPSKARVLEQVTIMQDAYDGDQSAESATAGVTFLVKSFERVRSQRWLTASAYDRASREMKRKLHKGGRAALNVYFTKPRADSVGGFILGWSTWPWEVARSPKQDGVVINVSSLPGGSATGYNRGDTAVHEVGHWLGLFHTFQGGCSNDDRVVDTPAERKPSYGCREGRDTCTADGLDPIHNFMDYSLDDCMDRFTDGQVSRTNDMWLAFRTP